MKENFGIKTCSNCKFYNKKHLCDFGFYHMHVTEEMAKTYCCDHHIKKEEPTK